MQKREILSLRLRQNIYDKRYFVVFIRFYHKMLDRDNLDSYFLEKKKRVKMKEIH